MNDLPNCVDNADITMYADDTSASTTIESVSDVEYKLIPGLIVDDRLSWKEHISYISSKVSRNIGILKRVRECVTKETLLIMYRTSIETYFRYCNTTWGNCGTTLLKKLQTFQNRAARVIEGVKYDEADHPKILRSLNILNVHQLVMLDTASLVYKINND